MNSILNTYFNRTLPESAGIFLFRLVMGSAFTLHGLPKMMHAFNWMGDGVPSLLQALAAFSEFGGGAALILGLLTPVATLGIIATMLGALFMVHFPAHDPFVANMPGKGSFEPALGYLTSAVLLLLIGPGRISLDYLLFGRSNPPIAATIERTPAKVSR